MVKGFFEKVKKMVDDFIYDVKTMFRQAIDKILKFVQENPELSIAIATVAVPAVVKGVKSISNAVEAKCEEHHRLRQTYDRRTDEYLNLKRPLKAKEKEELAIRMDRGESKTMILMDMGLLSW